MQVTVAASVLWVVLLLFVFVPLRANGEENMAYASTSKAYDIPDVILINAEGKQVFLREELNLDTPVFVNFIFTSCSSFCPLLTATLAKVQTELLKQKKPFRLVSISIDPEQDTPARLKAYAESFRAQSDWHFLTGGTQNMRVVQQAFDAYRGGKMNHAALILMRLPQDGRWVRFEGLISAERLVDEFLQNDGAKS